MKFTAFITVLQWNEKKICDEMRVRPGAALDGTRDIEAEIPENGCFLATLGEDELESETGWIQSPCKSRKNYEKLFSNTENSNYFAIHISV